MKLWGGRFEKASDRAMDDFHSSIAFDQRMARQDIEGSIAHAVMLGEQGIIPDADAQLIVEGLKGILADVDRGAISFETDAEDIHMNVERILTERIGDAGKRLHTGRSRNDQVALDARMYAKVAIDQTAAELKGLMEAILHIAEGNLTTVMPGYTHLQKAQPITLAHHMMAWFQMFKRDADRLHDCRRRTDVMPLGSGALAGTTYPLDRDRVKELLHFSAISENSMDGVSDRDFMLEYLSCAAISMTHLSRCCEEVILWATNEFGFIELDDAYSTGSSIMPQKKNPDVAELIRGKSGRVIGDLTGLLVTMKGLPLAYNKDMQEDKEAFFDAVDTWTACLNMFTRMLLTTHFHAKRMEAGAAGGFTNATDLADYLVKKGLPFREAHAVSGRMVLDCVKREIALLDLTLDEMRAYSPLFDDDIYTAISILECVNQRAIPGGPAPEAVAQSILSAKTFLTEI